jgi:hypothetical protein
MQFAFFSFNHAENNITTSKYDFHIARHQYISILMVCRWNFNNFYRNRWHKSRQACNRGGFGAIFWRTFTIGKLPVHRLR